jgi:hypothetical protein
MRKTNIKPKNSNRSRGFTLLYAVLVVGALMSMVFAVLNIVFKQASIANIAKNSTVSFYAADSGIECGRYWSSYGAFNVVNPSSPGAFSSIYCLSNTVSATVQSGSMLGNPISAAGRYDSAYPFPNNDNPFYFTYPLNKAYSTLASPPQAELYIWQNGQYVAPSATSSQLTTAVLSLGSNNGNINDPLRVQRGEGQQAAVTQCLAAALVPGIDVLYTDGSPSLTNVDLGAFFPVIAPYFPGESIKSLTSKVAPGGKTCLGNKTDCLNRGSTISTFPYLSILSPFDAWTPSNLDVNVQATLLKVPNDGNTYTFGIYNDGSPDGFQSLASVGPMATTTSQYYDLLPGIQVHFALQITDSSGNLISFWSTKSADNTSNVITSGVNVPHVVTFATPLPKNITDTANMNIGSMGGKYILGFGSTINSGGNPSATFSDAIALLSLAGCP